MAYGRNAIMCSILGRNIMDHDIIMCDNGVTVKLKLLKGREAVCGGTS
jgi:hypothetical protein